MTAPIGAVIGGVRDRAAAADPGLARLMLAARGTLSVLLTTLAALLASRLTGMPPVVFASGITLSMMGPFMMREPTRRQRQRTLLTLLVPAALATLATGVLHGYGSLGDSWFLALVFVCFLIQPRDPRMIGVGLVAVITTYVGLYLELPPATLPAQLLFLAAAVPVIAFACLVAVPMNPAATLRRSVTAIRWRVARVMHSAREVADGDGEPRGARRRAARKALGRDLARLNEAVLAADDQVLLLQPGGQEAFRARLAHLELVTGRLIEALRRETPGPRHAARLALHARRVRRGQPYVMPVASLERGSLLATLVELGHTSHALGHAAQSMVPAREDSRGAGLPAGRLAWRMATRVTLAGAVAMAGGMALSPQRWFWAVITVYVVFLNARSRGDTIYKGIQRLGGTVLGIASGLVLATGLAGHPAVQTAVLLLSIFGMFYLFLSSYTAGIFCVTVMLGLLYGMLGAPLETVLVLRLEETGIGAVAAILVAAFVLPLRTRDQVMRSGRNVLTALVEAVRVSGQALAGEAGAAPAEAMRRVDRQLADLRLALAPLTAGRFLLRRAALERPIPTLLDCVHWTRELAAAAIDGTPHAPALAIRASRVEARLAGLAGSDALPPEPPAAPHEASDDPAARALDNLDAAVASLAERLELGALEGFALDA